MNYYEVLDKILGSEFAIQWVKERNVEHEKEFYGHEMDEYHWKSNLLYNFFEHNLEEIVKVLPEVWEEIKKGVRDELEALLMNVGEFDEACDTGIWGKGVRVGFYLSDYLGNLEKDLQIELRRRYEK